MMLKLSIAVATVGVAVFLWFADAREMMQLPPRDTSR